MRSSRSVFAKRPLGLPSFDGWRLGGLLACLILALPIAALAGLASTSSDPIWGIYGQLFCRGKSKRRYY